MDKFVRAFNEDGRDFIRASTGRMKEWHDSEGKVVIPTKTSHGHKNKKNAPAPTAQIVPVPQLISHFVMNLPATAIEFLSITVPKRSTDNRCISWTIPG